VALKRWKLYVIKEVNRKFISCKESIRSVNPRYQGTVVTRGLFHTKVALEVLILVIKELTGSLFHTKGALERRVIFHFTDAQNCTVRTFR